VKFGIGPLSGQILDGSDATLTEVYRNELDVVENADELGFDSAWFAEHHFVRDGHYSAPLTMATAAGARTSNITLGTSVLLAPLYDPVRLAEEAATIDRLTGGRLELGIGMGYRDAEYEGFGVERSEQVARLVETAKILKQALSGDTVSIEGKVYQYDDIEVSPTPHQTGGPPVQIGATSERAIRRAAHIGEGWIAGQLFGLPELKKRIGWLKDEMDTDQIEVPVLRHGFVAETDDAAWDAVVDGVEHRIQNYLRWDDKEWSPEYLRRTREKGLFGSPETVTAELNRHDDELEDDIHWILWFSYPGVEKEQLIRSMELFVDEVVPQLDSQ